MTKLDQLIDSLVRDITKVGFMPKSEARRRLWELYEAAYQSAIDEAIESLEDEDFDYKVKFDILIIPPKEVIDRVEDFKDGYNAGISQARSSLTKLLNKTE